MFDGPLGSLFIRLAAPMFLGMLFNLGYTTADTLFVSAMDRSNPAIIGGIGLVFPMMFVAIALASGVMIGVSSLVARAIGERNREVLNRVADSGLALAVGIGSLLVIGGYLLSRWFVVDLMGADAAYAFYALEYFRWILPGLGLMIVFHVLVGVVQGEGLMKHLMVNMIAGNLLNILLDPFFILERVGVLPGLGLGVRGAALATIIAQTLAGFYLIGVFVAGRTTVPVAWSPRHIRLPIIGQIVMVGLPGALSQALLAFTFLIVNRILMDIDPLSVTAATLCGRIDQIIIMPILALSTAQLTIVGQNIGRGRLDRARRAWRTGVALAMSATLAAATLLVAAAPWIYRAFTADPAVLSYAVRQTRMVEYSFVMAAAAMMARSVFQAVGRPWPGLIITFLRMIGLMVPFVFVFVYILDWGIYGVWGGMIVGNGLGMALSLGWVRVFWEKVSSGRSDYVHTRA